MLTRKTALARLRATGTLAEGALPRNVVARADISSKAAGKIRYVIRLNDTGTGPRHLAGATNQMVLP
jgi:hypothetical protein